MKKECPICGKPFSIMDIVLAESTIAFQCQHCWSRVNATGPAGLEVHSGIRRPLMPSARRPAARRRKK